MVETIHIPMTEMANVRHRDVKPFVNYPKPHLEWVELELELRHWLQLPPKKDTHHYHPHLWGSQLVGVLHGAQVGPEFSNNNRLGRNLGYRREVKLRMGVRG